jgi:hypothetical protein
MDYVHADHGSGTAMFGQERQPAMTAKEENTAMQLRVWTAGRILPRNGSPSDHSLSGLDRL